MTSFLAILVGWVTYILFPIGDTSLKSVINSGASEMISAADSVNVSIRDTLVGIIPSDIISPFLNADMIQIIFLAVVTGMSAASINDSHPEFKRSIIMMNGMFGTFTVKLMMFMPLMVFCSMARMMLSMELASLKSIFVWIPVLCFGFLVMVCVYTTLFVVLTHLNPIHFFRKMVKVIVTAITLSSSNATVPTTVEQCEKMGISNKVYSFSIPLGATINMDGCCVMLMITSMFMAKIFGVNLESAQIISLIVSIMVLSVGAPGVPGGALVSLTLLLQQIHVPGEAISLVIGIYPIVSMLLTGANVTGDAVVTAIVAKQEKLLDVEKYKS